MEDVRVYTTKHNIYVTDEQNLVSADSTGQLKERARLLGFGPLRPGEALHFNNRLPYDKFFEIGERVLYNTGKFDVIKCRVTEIEIIARKQIPMLEYAHAIQIFQFGQESTGPRPKTLKEIIDQIR